MDGGCARPGLVPHDLVVDHDGTAAVRSLACSSSPRMVASSARDARRPSRAPASAQAVGSFSQRDALTGLPDHRLFRQALAQAIAAAPCGSTLALLLIDIDGFREVNDRLGHDAGDALLVEVAYRIKHALGGDSVAARLGSDEFGLFIVGQGPHAEPTKLAADVRARIGEPIELGLEALSIEASVGVALHPHDAGGADALLKRAAIALQHAKGLPHGRVACFGPAMQQDGRTRAHLLQAVHDALRAGQIEPFYQPIIDLRTRVCRGLEALVRWRHPERGVLTPAAFAPALDDPDLSVVLSDYVLERAVVQMRRWLDAGLPASCVVNVNVVIGQFRQRDLVARIRRLLAVNGLAPEQLKLEVTEGVFLDRQVDGVGETLEELRHEGVLSALDDFGTGYASLTHLKHFKVDRLKIDRSFVSNICDDAGDRAIVRAILDLGRSFGLRVTAEGIETKAQLRRLIEMGCDCGQGFLFSRPMPAEDVTPFLERWYECGAAQVFDALAG